MTAFWAAVILCLSAHSQALAVAGPTAQLQAAEPAPVHLSEAAFSSSSSSIPLPDAPRSAPAAATLPPASHTQEIIDPGQDAPVISGGDKVLLGLRSSVTPYSAVGWLAAAGYEQLTNGSPNYGTDRGAFGQRLGAAALRAGTENVFSESVFAPIFHEDPRYYRMGNSRNLVVRIIYAGTRPLINRTDKGNNSVNLALLVGNLAGSELTYAYYPQANRSQSQILETFGGSVGGSALGYVVDELLGSVGHAVHAQK